MFLEVKTLQEFHDNGNLMYEETRAYLSPLSEHLYERRVGYDGNTFIRIGRHIKLHDNGIIEWELTHDEKTGEVIAIKKGFRKDGTPRR